jgi:hypothetical protein
MKKKSILFNKPKGSFLESNTRLNEVIPQSNNNSKEKLFVKQGQKVERV